MKKAMARFFLAITAAIVLVLICYGLARAYLAYEAARAGQMLKELEAVKVGDSETLVLPIVRKYGGYRRVLEPRTNPDHTDYDYQVEIGPSGIYLVADHTNTSMFYRTIRAVLSSFNPRLRRAIGLRRWNAFGVIGFRENHVIVVYGTVMVEGSNEWLSGQWRLSETIPESEINRFVTSPAVYWPQMNRYLLGWYHLRFSREDGGGENLKALSLRLQRRTKNNPHICSRCSV